MASRLEAERAQRIASNKKRMAELGVGEAHTSLAAASASPAKKPKKGAAKKVSAGGDAAAEPPRRTGRQRREVTYSEPSMAQVLAAAPDAPEREPLPAYSPPTEPPAAHRVTPSFDAADGCKRDKQGRLVFPGFEDFRPNLTPKQVIQAGSFGGIYFNPQGGKPGIRGKSVAVAASDHPAEWFEGLPRGAYAGRIYTKGRNKYGIKAGQDQAFWEEKGWIADQDPRGWFQWYCRFFTGRRTVDDARQISRWKGVVGDKGRWVRALCNKIIAANKRYDDASVSPVIRQTLLHWAFELTEDEFERMRAHIESS